MSHEFKVFRRSDLIRIASTPSASLWSNLAHLFHHRCAKTIFATSSFHFLSRRYSANYSIFLLLIVLWVKITFRCENKAIVAQLVENARSALQTETESLAKA
jgi:hypothetical protein